jgi:mono/diheme cytochrome c family protein
VFDVQTIDATTLAKEKKLGLRSLLPDCLLPRGAIANDQRVVVACHGQSELAEIDSFGGWPTKIRRYEVPRGPLAIAIVPGGKRAVVWSSIARAVSIVELGGGYDAKEKSKKALMVAEIARVRPLDESIARGREIFHRSGDRTISRDGLACASCHPDGRDDGIVWGSPKGRRRPITLAGNETRAATFGWGAESATIEEHVTETIQRLGGRGLAKDDLASVLAYVRSLKPIPRAEREPSTEAQRGENVFRDRGCTSCHDEASGFSDHLPHDVGGGGPTVTPSLLGVGARATLFHDGRYEGIDKLLTNAKSMGNVGALSADDRKALAAFLVTL